MSELFGTLIPIGGGDPIPLMQEVLTIGRRSSCDIRLDFPNVSGLHCELSYRGGVWTIRDMGSSNGVKVDGERAQARTLRPGSEISIAGHLFKLDYTPPLGSHLDELRDEEENVFGQSLLERAGLSKKSNRS